MSEPRRIEVNGAVACTSCPFEVYDADTLDARSCVVADRRLPANTPPDWCPLRPENGGPVLVVLSEEAGRG